MERQAVAPPSVVGRRIGAGLVDLVLMMIVFAVLADWLRTAETVDGVESSTLSGGAILAYLVVFLGYYAAAEGLFGTTIGKALFGLIVVTVDGEFPRFGAVLTRTVLRLVDGLPLVYVVGTITMFASARDQRLGDIAAETLVVDRRLR